MRNTILVQVALHLAKGFQTAPYPYQLATVIARDATTGVELARSTVVAPVSTEMHCDYCHSDGDQEDIATGRVETNILTLHDRENSDKYPPGHDTPLIDRRPVLCAELSFLYRGVA